MGGKTQKNLAGLGVGFSSVFDKIDKEHYFGFFEEERPENSIFYALAHEPGRISDPARALLDNLINQRDLLIVSQKIRPTRPPR